MIRLYGHARGEASFAQVTRGLRSVLASTDNLAGFYSVDDQQLDQSMPPGSDAPVALNVGAPMATALTHVVGRHKRHWLLLAPNSEQLPEGLAKALSESTAQYPNGLIDGVLAPSAWAAGVLGRAMPGIEVVEAPHGVNPEIHKPDLNAHHHVQWAFRDGRFSVLHLTSTDTERKGTPHLLLAWKQLMAAKSLPELAKLHVVVDPYNMNDLRRWLLHNGLFEEPSIRLHAGLSRSQTELAQLYRWSHVVCQPSRGEGFGLVPLEARCCGTPVVTTTACGHSEHVKEGDIGVEIVPTGPDLAPQRDFSGSLSPRLEHEDVAAALLRAYNNWNELSAAAFSNATGLAQEWSWAAKNASILRRIGEQHTCPTKKTPPPASTINTTANSSASSSTSRSRP